MEATSVLKIKRPSFYIFQLKKVLYHPGDDRLLLYAMMVLAASEFLSAPAFVIDWRAGSVTYGRADSFLQLSLAERI